MIIQVAVRCMRRVAGQTMIIQSLDHKPGL